jgi:hypothetical protein
MDIQMLYFLSKELKPKEDYYYMMAQFESVHEDDHRKKYGNFVFWHTVRRHGHPLYKLVVYKRNEVDNGPSSTL